MNLRGRLQTRDRTSRSPSVSGPVATVRRVVGTVAAARGVVGTVAAARRVVGTGAGAGALMLAVATTLGGCGEIVNTITPKPSTANQVKVELAGPPNAYYVGLYAAQALGYFKQTDIDVVIQTPSPGQNPLTMLHNGQVLAAVSSEPSVFLSRNQEMPVVAIGALVRDPLSEIPIPVLPAQPTSGGKGITKTTRKRKTRAKTTTTAPTTPTTTGTGTTTATTTATTGTVTSGTTTGTTTTATTTTPTPSQVPSGAAWPGTLQSLLAQPSAPTYNGLVVVVRKGTIVDHAGLPRRFIQAVRRGYAAVRRDPRAGVAALIAADPGLAAQKRALLATVRSLLPYFFPSGTIWGWQSERNWNTFGTWLYNNKLINNPNAVTDASTNELLQGEGV
jgi:putative hydroxymethylpyrimidine transport system substrate-binding protein